MGAPKGNQFWKLRSKHGRDKIFKDPETMLEACYDYFDHQSKEVWEKVDFKGKDAIEVRIPTSAPFTLTGLCIYLDVNTAYFNQFEKNCSKDFSKVITHVRDIIYKQKYEGAVTGAFNPNIIARDLGLKDHVDNTTKGESLNKPVSVEKAKQIAKDLKKEI